jgi:hypothetical protein
MKVRQELCVDRPSHQAKLDEDTIRAFCREQIAHWVPRYIRMVASSRRP